MPLTLQGARLVDACGDHPHSHITLCNTHISAIGATPPHTGTTIDASDAIIMPGFIEVHTHGGGSFNLHTNDTDEIHAYARWVPSTGTTAFLVGVVGIPHEMPLVQLRTATIAIQHGEIGAEAVGIHLEGPYINVRRRGAHEPSWMRMPSETETKQILALTAGQLALVTLAPELPQAEAMIQRLRAAGVTVSMGHTDVDYDGAYQAIALGVTHATHCFNAMPPLHHRAPGPLGAIVESPQVYGELIADGHHVHPAAMRLLFQAIGPKRTIIITDALAGAGIPNAEFVFADRTARVIDGVARLSDGTITGSVLTMDQALRNLMAWFDLTLSDAVRMMTYNPAIAARVSHRKGLLQPGYDADLAVFDTDFQLQATFCRGMLLYATDAWQARLERCIATPSSTG